MKLNEHSKDLRLKQERIVIQHDSLMEEFTELKQIKEIGEEERKRKLPKNRGIEG